VRVLVCGGRDYRDASEVGRVLLDLHERVPITCLIEGGAPGVDAHAERWAMAHGIHVKEYRADWHHLGRAAGPLRNQRMIDEGKPELVVAFPGGRGTADMVRRARTAGVEVLLPKVTA
jgi:hypothetical protein